MAAPCRQNLFQLVRRHILKQRKRFDKVFSKNLGAVTNVFKSEQFGAHKLKSVKVFAGIVGVSSVFAARSLWNSVTAEPLVTEQSVIANDKGIADSRDIRLTLYQFQSCPFCCKVRAALDYYGFSYKVVEVNSVTKQQLKFSQYKKVPVLVYEAENGEDFVTMTDSSVIMSMLVSHLFDPSVDFATLKSYYPALEIKKKWRKKWEFPNKYFIMYGESTADARTEKQRNKEADREERKWRAWVDDHLVHMISPNVYRTPSESLEAFYHFSDWGQWEKNFSAFQRLMVIYVGAPVMYVIGKIIKRRHNLNEDVRLSLYHACDEWMKVLGKRKYLGGDEPCIADLSVYGVLSSFEGCQAFQDLMNNSKIRKWYYRTQQDIREHKGAQLSRAAVK